MKKILAAILTIALTVALAGCMSTASKTPTATDPADSAKIRYTDYGNSLEGLCKYLDDLGYMVFDYNTSDDESGSATIKMNAELIGAEKGYKSCYSYNNKSWVVEAYYYDDTESEMYKQAQSGTFTVSREIEDGSFKITVNGSFALVVNAPEDGTQREEEIIKAFMEFYPTKG